MRRIDSNSDFYGAGGIANLSGQRREPLGTFLGSIPMAFRPFVSRLSVVTAYIAFAFVGAIVLGVF